MDNKNYLIFTGMHFIECSCTGAHVSNKEIDAARAYVEYTGTYNGYGLECHIAELREDLTIEEVINRLSKGETGFQLAYIQKYDVGGPNIELVTSISKFKNITLENIQEIKEIIDEVEDNYIIHKSWMLSDSKLEELAKKYNLKSEEEKAEELLNSIDFNTVL